MSRKIKHEQYEILVTFKSDNCMSISAQFLPTGEHFINNAAELIRINKQTVFASLERKSDKHLKCEFQQIVEDGKKQLIIVFVVNFDFLPEFKEEVRLEYVDQKESLKGLNLMNMQTQISEMDKALDSMIKNQSATIHQETSVTFTNNNLVKEFWSKDVNQGKYIVRCSGTINQPSGVQTTGKLCFFVEKPGEKEESSIQIRTHHTSGYHYPFSMSELVDCRRQGTLKLKMSFTSMNATAMNVHVVLNRVTPVN